MKKELFVLSEDTKLQPPLKKVQEEAIKIILEEIKKEEKK